MATPDNEILAVVTNWRRPLNIPAVVAALRTQSVPVDIVIVDNSPAGEWPLHKLNIYLDAGSDVWRINNNLGPCCRFLPPMALPQYKYVYFQVDDYLPGPRCVEWFKRCAEWLEGDFATLGQDGRRVDMESMTLGRRRVRQRELGDFALADVITSSEFVLRENVVHAIEFREKMAANLAEGEGFSFFEDDLFLCFGIQQAVRAPSYVVPHAQSEFGGDKTSWRIKSLPADHALSARADHHERRDLFVRQAVKAGWGSFCK